MAGIFKRAQDYLQAYSVKNRLMILILLNSVFILLISSAIVYYQFDKDLTDEKIAQTAHITEAALNQVEHYAQLAQNGQISEGEAKNRAKEVIGAIKYDEDNYVWINDYDSRFVVHPNKKLIGVVIEEDVKGKPFLQELTKMSREEGSAEISYFWTKPGEGDKPFSKVAYARAYEKWGWIIATGVYTDDIKAIVLQGNMIIFLGSFIGVILIIILAYFTFAKSIIAPIEEITKTSLELANNNLGVDIPDDKHQTEIGELNRSFKKMVVNFRTLIGQVTKSIEEISAGSEEMHAAAEQTAQGAQQVADSICQLAAGTQEQANSVGTSVASVNLIDTAIKTILSDADNAVALSEGTAKDAEKGSLQAKDAVRKINKVKENSEEIAKTIHELGDLSSEIETIVDLIKGIAGQTNLLALNAAIEAARAGEHGKGFAVVAEEVKKLAGQSAEATEKITAMIKEIQSKTAVAVEKMESGVEEVEQGAQNVDEMGSSLQEILNAAESTKEKVGHISEELLKLKTSSDNVVKAMENISSITEETAASTEEISSISEEQTASMEEINASSQALAKIAENLQVQISVFRI